MWQGWEFDVSFCSFIKNSFLPSTPPQTQKGVSITTYKLSLRIGNIHIGANKDNVQTQIIRHYLRRIETQSP